MRKKLTVTKAAHHRAAYHRKDGTPVSGAHVPPSRFKIEDRGKPGRTPKSERFFDPQVHTGWRKDLAPRTRRTRALKAHGGNLLATAHGLQALSNVTTDRATKRLAALDARHFFARHRKGR